jgi:hypothetical protein
MRSAAQRCELCGKRLKTFKRFGARVLRSYSAVCKPCIQEHFSPTTIVVDPAKAGHVAPSDWVPSEWMPV